MKTKRLLFIVIITVLLVICWLVGLRKLSGVDEKREQAEYISQADAFMERELYVRAIPLYEQALEYNIPSTKNETEEKLLDAYLKSGSVTSYNKLVIKRSEEGTAKENEYITMATNYFEAGSYKNGLESIELGIDKLSLEGIECKELLNLYEEKRYAYKKRVLSYPYAESNSNNRTFKVYDGSKYGYVTAENNILIPCIYDRATVVTKSGYAFVTLDGVDYTIVLPGDNYGVNDGKATETSSIINFDMFVTAESNYRLLGVVDGKYGYYGPDFNLISIDVQYDFISAMEPEVGAVVMNEKGKWALMNSDMTLTTDFIYDDVALNSLGRAFSGGRACVCEDGKWFVVDINGEHLIDESFDGLKAPEGDAESYIAACDSKGKWGFIDSEGNLAIDYSYFDAYSFSDSVAAIRRSADDWVYISERGEIVIDENIKWAEPFHSGTAITGNYEGTVTLIQFKYIGQ